MALVERKGNTAEGFETVSRISIPLQRPRFPGLDFGLFFRRRLDSGLDLLAVARVVSPYSGAISGSGIAVRLERLAPLLASSH